MQEVTGNDYKVLLQRRPRFERPKYRTTLLHILENTGSIFRPVKKEETVLLMRSIRSDTWVYTCATIHMYRGKNSTVNKNNGDEYSE